MKAKRNQQEIKISLLRAIAKQVHEIYAGVDDLEGSDLILQLIALYTDELQRQLNGETGTIEYLFQSLKSGARLALDLIRQLETERPEALEDWAPGNQPTNTVQFFEHLFYESLTELNRSVRDVEEEFPILRQHFDWEALGYESAYHQCA